MPAVNSGQPTSPLTTHTGLVLRSQSGQYWVSLQQGAALKGKALGEAAERDSEPLGEVVHCRLRGRLKRDRRKVTDLVVIGDRVELSLLDEEGEGVIESVHPRENRFSRRQPGPRARFKEHVLVANVHRVFAVFACSKPEFNPRLLDRLLVVAELDELPVTIVANKVDEVELEEAQALFGAYSDIGYQVVYTSALGGEGLETLRRDLGLGVCAFIGPSGVGKSSLLNTISPGLNLAVGSLSASLDKGRHTTRVAQLHPLSGGGLLADTPGFRELASFELPERELPRCFPEMRAYLDLCRFPNCSHDHEPGCRVLDAVKEGDISLDRYESYLRILHDGER